MKIFNKGFNFSQDGPGNRLVYHLCGCNMRCPWCSNIDGIVSSAGKEYTPKQILEESVACKPMMFSSGGVTFTGGEATLWHSELTETLSLLKRADIHTALETNGTSEKLTELLKNIDYLIMDFKHYDSDVLKRYTGVGNEIVAENFKKICSINRQIHVRIPLINSFNTDHPQKFADFFADNDCSNAVFEFLRYHEYGKDKWLKSGLEYTVENGFVCEEILDDFVKTFKEYGLKTVTT